MERRERKERERERGVKEGRRNEEEKSGEKEEDEESRKEERLDTAMAKEERKLHFWLAQAGSEPLIIGLSLAFEAFPSVPFSRDLSVPIAITTLVPASTSNTHIHTQTHTYTRTHSRATVVGISLPEGVCDRTNSHRPRKLQKKSSRGVGGGVGVGVSRARSTGSSPILDLRRKAGADESELGGGRVSGVEERERSKEERDMRDTGKKAPETLLAILVSKPDLWKELAVYVDESSLCGSDRGILDVLSSFLTRREGGVEEEEDLAGKTQTLGPLSFTNLEKVDMSIIPSLTSEDCAKAKVQFAFFPLRN